MHILYGSELWNPQQKNLYKPLQLILKRFACLLPGKESTESKLAALEIPVIERL